MLYHFVTSHIRRDSSFNLPEHHREIIESGALKPPNMRDTSVRGMLTKKDPVEDFDCIFLTGDRKLWRDGLKEMKHAYPKYQHVDERIFGFVFDDNDLRYSSNVYYRRRDILEFMPSFLSNEHKSSVRNSYTELFTDQPITDKCEILIEGFVSMDLVREFIIDDEEVPNVWYAQDRPKQDGNKLYCPLPPLRRQNSVPSSP